MIKIIKPASLIAGILMLSACANLSPTVDPASFQVMPSDADMIQIPPVCKSSYSIDTPRVAITAFTNNTTYGDMTANNTQINHKSNKTSVSAGAAGVVAAPGAVGLGYVGANNTQVQSNTQVDSFYRQISSKVGEYAQSAVESTITKMGGAQVYDRKKLDQIMNEQKFQMTIGDPATAVQLGKMAGVQYIITGTVDNISTQYLERVDQNNNVKGGLGAFLSIATVAANTQAGWNVYVEMTVSMIDVSTGQVILSEKVKGHENGGSARNFNPEMSLNAAKKAMGEAVEDIKPIFSEKFAQKGYIQQLRGGKQVALINIGSSNGIQPGTKLDAYDFIIVTDPFTNASTCNMSKIPVELTVTDQVQPNASWVKIEGNKDVIARLKVGTIVVRQKLGGQNMFQKLF